MVEMSCPGCGRAGQVPKEKLHTRLVCKKCHVVFHVDQSGRALLGDPNQVGKKDPKKKTAKAGEPSSLLVKLGLQKLQTLNQMGDNLSETGFPVKPAAAIAAVLLVGWLILGYANAAPESVADPARRAVDALTHDNLDRLKSYATEDSLSDVIRWYDLQHGKLEAARKTWPGKDASVQIVIVEEDHSKQKGVVEAFLLPAPSTQTASVLPSADTKSGSKATAPSGPVGFQLHWVWSGGKWRLDGRQTFAVAAQ